MKPRGGGRPDRTTRFALPFLVFALVVDAIFLVTHWSAVLSLSGAIGALLGLIWASLLVSLIWAGTREIAPRFRIAGGIVLAVGAIAWCVVFSTAFHRYNHTLDRPESSAGIGSCSAGLVAGVAIAVVYRRLKRREGL